MLPRRHASRVVATDGAWGNDRYSPGDLNLVTRAATPAPPRAPSADGAGDAEGAAAAGAGADGETDADAAGGTDTGAAAAAPVTKKTKAKGAAEKKKLNKAELKAELAQAAVKAKAAEARAVQDAGGWIVHSLVDRKARDRELEAFRAVPTPAAGSAVAAGSAAATDDDGGGDARRLLHLTKSGSASETLSGVDLPGVEVCSSLVMPVCRIRNMSLA